MDDFIDDGANENFNVMKYGGTFNARAFRPMSRDAPGWSRYHQMRQMRATNPKWRAVFVPMKENDVRATLEAGRGRTPVGPPRGGSVTPVNYPADTPEPVDIPLPPSPVPFHDSPPADVVNPSPVYAAPVEEEDDQWLDRMRGNLRQATSVPGVAKRKFAGLVRKHISGPLRKRHIGALGAEAILEGFVQRAERGRAKRSRADLYAPLQYPSSYRKRGKYAR